MDTTPNLTRPYSTNGAPWPWAAMIIRTKHRSVRRSTWSTVKTYTNEQLYAIEKKLNLHFTEAQREIYRNIGGTAIFRPAFIPYLAKLLKAWIFIDKVTAVTVNKDGNPDKEVWMKITVLADKQVAKELKGGDI